MPSPLGEEQGRQSGADVAGADSQVAGQGLPGAFPERERPLPVTLAADHDEVAP